MKRRVIILGSTGSIGTSALDVVAALADELDVVGLAANSSWQTLAEQVRQFAPQRVAMADPASAARLRSELDGTAEVLEGDDALSDLVERTDCDFVLSAVVGAAALPATAAALRLGRTVGLANKESLVVAGSIMMNLARKTGARVIPVDSEHSAIFQAMHAGRAEELERIYLTASGGPFRTWSAEQIAQATLQDALNHPTWNMGPKITIDSATMMNKALEVIEAKWLFDVSPDLIEVVIHPESIIHSMAEFCDGSIVAQLGSPDMRTPIQYALTYPARRAGPSRRLDIKSLRRMNFEPPDPERFPALELGYQVARTGGTSGAVFNAANEAAVQMFRGGEIRFVDIVDAVSQVLSDHDVTREPTLEDLMQADAWARAQVEHTILGHRSGRA
ncbi:MAG: 1-deoxy-D-xylulose-5-phosphate reductoisomerase [Phycisphaerae bacterium]|nr:1-deoxy-D-xylulose-5-phosphate reductoisomerase [Phycisphaerae bacterium]